MLRRVLLAIGVAGLLAGVGCLAAGLSAPGLQLTVGFGVLTAGLAFERWRYVRSGDRSWGPWEATGERFVDPTTDRLIEVYYNPETGERDYRPVDAERLDAGSGRGS